QLGVCGGRRRQWQYHCGGKFSGAIDFSGGNFTGGQMSFSSPTPDAFVVKLSGGNGALLWQQRAGDSVGAAQVNGVATDASGNVFATGAFYSTMTWGRGATLRSNAAVQVGGNDSFVVKLAAADGSNLWSRNFSSNNDDFGVGVAVDGSGNALVTGYFAGAITLGTSSVTSAGGYDAYVVKLGASSGSTLWSWHGGGAENDMPYAVGV